MIQKEIQEILKCIKDKKTLLNTNVDIWNDEKIKEIEIRIDKLVETNNVKLDKSVICSIEDLDREFSNLFNIEKKKSKYYEKLSGFWSTRKRNFLWDDSKIDEFFSSLMT